ncbi:MAG: addiction module antidote protein, HigA family [Spirochaetes bacterium GWD1_61_31]|nr:MAG: addiction module antidote protein, HigA family [Spirochaetes bacterium GWB1_60_80]OHD31678.1 MAG: addiction module antidote protein, HigA family [Spirochaetes bacterium GWC1_61_12]OHD41475.1 MAG: addiction module antidote protein, HigA family [Spirochaetes bacterium GWE1_60_18]OHD41519.1 MAG: addiction module antidote protein, HigA family [Spirochaetes bacterium GWD1_61_31]OHD61377.1 MAG: addiction module antidote protein, HigA family [Spirochaetes bacterium GWF1_60_12]HAP42482.1 addic
MTKRKPTHPGAVLREDVLAELGLSVTEAARDMGITRKALSEFLHEKSALSPAMAIWIGRATNTSPESWLAMQLKLDIWIASSKVGPVIPFPAAQARHKPASTQKR